MECSNRDLSPEAKLQIREYMTRLVTVPSLIASIAMFALGFFVNDVARAGAYNQAYSEAIGKVLELSQQASDACAKATLASREALEMREKLKAIVDQSEKERPEIIKGVTTDLARDDAFQHSIAVEASTALEPHLNELRKSLGELKEVLHGHDARLKPLEDWRERFKAAASRTPPPTPGPQ